MKKFVLPLILASLLLSGCNTPNKKSSAVSSESSSSLVNSSKSEEGTTSDKSSLLSSDEESESLSEEESSEELSSEEETSSEELSSEEESSEELSSEELSEESSFDESSLESSESSEESSEVSSEQSSEESSEEISVSSHTSSSEEEEGPINLGEMTIYQALNTFDKLNIPTNEFGNGVDFTHTITIKGMALLNFSLQKTTKKFGLDVSSPYKTIMADSTYYIACASNYVSASAGNSLYGKVGDYAGQETSKYVVTGYPSIYLGQYELYVPDKSFTWDSSLNVSVNMEKLWFDNKTITDFIEDASSVHYNCAGFGYGRIHKISGVRCYYYNAKDKYYLFNDGQNIIKVLKGACSATVGGVYDIIGMVTTADYAPAMRAISIASSSWSCADTIDLSHATEITATDLCKIKTSQDDTSERFDSFVKSFGKVYKTEAYIGAFTQNNKLYFTFNDSYLGNNYFTNEAQTASQKSVYITNDDFWNVSEEAAIKYNGYYADYLNENVSVTVYYTLMRIDYLTYNKVTYPRWKVMLLPETIPAVS